MDLYAAPMLAHLTDGPHDGETVEAVARSPHHPPTVIERVKRSVYLLDRIHPLTYHEGNPVRHYRWVPTS